MALPNTNEHIYEEEGFWLVGFTIPHLQGISIMSGMVDVVDVTVDPDRNAVVFVVRNLDQTGCLFKNGLLKATRIKEWRSPSQALATPCKADPNASVVSS